MSGNGIAGHVVLQAQTVAPTTGEAAAKGPRPDIAAGMAAADGRFRLTRLPPGAYVLRIQAPGFAPARVEVEVSEGDLQVDAGEIALETGLAIGGVVRNESGEAITDARVTAQPPGPDAPPPMETRSQADGSFLIAGLAAGIHVVTAAAAGYDGKSKRALAGASDVDLVLEEPKTGAVSGLVVDEGGQPVRSFEVRARRHDSPFAETDRGGRTFTTTDGRFVLDRLREESYRVEIAATAELASAVRDEVAVVAGQTTDLWVITLGRGGVLRGYVVDAVGAGVRNATVTVAGVGPDAAALPKRSGTTNGIGYFEVQAVPPGNVEAVVTHPSFARSRNATLHVDPSRGPTDVRIRMSSGGRITGFVRRRDVAALAKRLVQAVPLPLNPSDSPVEAFTRDDGSFELDHIPAGGARLTLMAGPVGRYSIALHRDLPVIEGANTHAELVSRDIVVFGRVTRAGMSMPRLRLLFEPRDLRFEEPDSSTRPGPPMSDEADAIPSSALEPMTAVTDERGDYQLLVTVPGKICLYVDAPQARFRYEPRVVEIPESADTHRLDLDLGGAMLSGTVVDDQGGPVPRALVSAIRVDKEPAVSTVETGPGGAFDLDLGPGKYVITARAQGYAAWRGDGEVHLEKGLSAEVSIALSRGLVAPGRVLDDKDHGVGNVHVYARATHVDPNPNRLSLGDGTSQMDGTFRILGLRDVPHILSARSDAGAFVIEPDVIPRSRGLKLTLRPGGRLLLRVVVGDLVPVEGAQAEVMAVDGTPVVFAPLLVGTDARGMLEMAIPAGIVTIRVWKVGLLREFTVQMARGGMETALVKMEAPP